MYNNVFLVNSKYALISNFNKALQDITVSIFFVKSELCLKYFK